MYLILGAVKQGSLLEELIPEMQSPVSVNCVVLARNVLKKHALIRLKTCKFISSPWDTPYWALSWCCVKTKAPAPKNSGSFQTLFSNNFACFYAFWDKLEPRQSILSSMSVFFIGLIHEHVDHVIIAKIVKSHSRYLTFSFHLFSEVERSVLYFMRFYFYDFNALKFDTDLWPISEV